MAATLITHDGFTDTIRGWATRLGLPPETIKSRIKEDRRSGRSLDPTRLLRPSVWHEDDQPSIAAAAAEGSRRRRLNQKQRWLATLAQLKAAPCTDCGGRFHPVAMDFDHRDPIEKLFVISKGPKKLELVLAEIAKCDLVCANCHRVRTWTKGHHTTRRDSPSKVEPAPPLRIATTAAEEPVASGPVYGVGRGTKQERVDLLLRIALQKDTGSSLRLDAARLAHELAGGARCPETSEAWT